MKRPLVFNFYSPVDYLNSFFDYQYYTDPKFMLKSWASSVGVKYPRLKDVLSGRTPIKSGYFENAQKLLEMSEDQFFYFQSLIRYHNAKKESDRKIFMTLLDHLKENSLSQDVNKQGDSFVSLDSKKHIFQNHLCMTILSMVHLKDFSFELDEIKSMLIYQSPREHVQTALNLLKEEGLIEVNDGLVTPKFNDYFTKSDVKLLPVHKYYENVSDLAKMAIEEDLSKREFQCFTFSLHQEDIVELKKMIRKFRYRLCRLEKSDADYVYQVNFQAFPVAQSPRLAKSVTM